MIVLTVAKPLFLFFACKNSKPTVITVLEIQSHDRQTKQRYLRLTVLTLAIEPKKSLTFIL